MENKLNKMHDIVFISHAKEDSESAEKLFDFLKSHGLDPWLDKRNIHIGQNWEIEISSALKKADFIVLLLSKTSVSKRGYFQKEFKRALDYCEEKLESDIYLIPCKIDDCEVPEKLNKFQWVELSKPDSFERILSALNLQRKKYEDHSKSINNINYNIDKTDADFETINELEQAKARTPIIVKRPVVEIPMFNFEELMKEYPSAKPVHAPCKGQIIWQYDLIDESTAPFEGSIIKRGDILCYIQNYYGIVPVEVGYGGTIVGTYAEQGKEVLKGQILAFIN